jgi:hypothetical protein
MRKTMVLLFAMSILAACSTIGDKAPADPRSTRTGWSNTDRKTFLVACEQGLEGNIKASGICSCVLEKMEKKYASLQLADEEGGEAAGAKAARECAGNVRYGEGFDNN